MNRRTLLGGIVGLSAIGVGGVVYQSRHSTTRVTSDDEETTVHHSDPITRPERYPVPDATRDETTDDGAPDGTDEGGGGQQSDEDDEGADRESGGDGSGDGDSPTSPTHRRQSGSDTGDDGGDDDSTSIEIEFTDENLDRFNSGSVSFVHEVFFVCNRGEECATVWIEADPIENEHGEPSVQFYRDGVLEDRLEDPDEVACLEPDDCLAVGVITRTAGIAAETLLLEEITVRTER